MKIGRVILALQLVIVSAWTISSCNNVEATKSSVRADQGNTIVTSQRTSVEIEPDPDMLAEDIVVDNLQIKDDYTYVTGQIEDFMEIDATLITTIDPMAPGNASTYTAAFNSFSASEEQRLMFVQPEWKLIESEIRPASFPYDEAYFDVYEDASGNQHRSILATDSAYYSTQQGALIAQVEVPAEYHAQTDFEFASEQEAFEVAKNFAETCGYSISDYYYVYRLPYEELELSSKLIDQSVVESALPQGWTAAQDAYKFMLFADIDGMLMCAAGSDPLSEEYSVQVSSAINIIVTSKGVEYARFYFQYNNTVVQSTGEMCNIEEALNLVAQSIFNGDTYLTPPLKIDYVYLAYIGQWEPSTAAVMLRPFWVMTARETDPNSFGSESYYYVDALNMTVTNDATYCGPEL